MCVFFRVVPFFFLWVSSVLFCRVFYISVILRTSRCLFLVFVVCCDFVGVFSRACPLVWVFRLLFFLVFSLFLSVPRYD